MVAREYEVNKIKLASAFLSSLSPVLLEKGFVGSMDFLLMQIILQCRHN
jgi:hypothetical protein